jgi:hypothetical protein
MTKMKKSAISLFFCISAISFAAGQEVTVTSAFDSSRIFLGDQINYRVTVDQPAGLRLKLPFFQDTLSNKIEIISGPSIDTVAAGSGRIKITEKYLVTSFDSGLYVVPPAFVEIQDENGLKRYYSDYTRLAVDRVNIAPADTAAKIFDIVGPYKAPLALGEIMPWILIALLAAAVVWLIIRYLKKRLKSHEDLEIIENPDPPHVIAFRELKRLLEEQLWQKGEVKLYYTELTEILREYLEKRFRVSSFEMTTSETLEALVKTGFKKDGSFKHLKAVLTGADLVKFAKHKPDAEENEIHFQQSWDFIEATKEVEIIMADDSGKHKKGEDKI